MYRLSDAEHMLLEIQQGPKVGFYLLGERQKSTVILIYAERFPTCNAAILDMLVQLADIICLETDETDESDKIRVF